MARRISPGWIVAVILVIAWGAPVASPQTPVRAPPGYHVHPDLITKVEMKADLWSGMVGFSAANLLFFLGVAYGAGKWRQRFASHSELLEEQSMRWRVAKLDEASRERRIDAVETQGAELAVMAAGLASGLAALRADFREMRS